MNIFDLLFISILLDLTTQAAARINDENVGIDSIAYFTPIPPPPPPVSAMLPRRTAEFKPGIAIIVAIITTIFSITLLVLLYVKHCRRSAYSVDSNGNPLSRGNSGINKKVIESLPMFRFSSLRGQKDGLECAVCLTRFEPTEVLRLLPKCKHAFHVECVDTWLDEHSTCPLCRYRVEPEDVLVVDNHSKTLYNHNNSDAITPRSSEKGKEVVGSSGRHSSGGERGASLEIIVEKSGQDLRGARASFDSWNSRRKPPSENLRSKSSNSWRSLTRKSGKSSENIGRKDGQLPVQGDKHRFEHQIIISDGGQGERRWSDVKAAEILFLKSEMILGEEEVIPARSVSEITGMSRFRSNNGGRERRERREREEEGFAKRWLDWIPHSHHNHKNAAAAAAAAAATAASSSSSSNVV